MKLRIWGVRGSIPCPGPNTVRYGGNTSCYELIFEDIGRRIVIDAGSGIRSLGENWMKEVLPKGPIRTDLFLTHTHWDHIMGFPFFIPIFIPTTKMNVYGPVTYEDDPLDRIVGDQLRYRYFPVRQEELSADITYRAIKECELDLGDGITLRAKYLNHPILCLGYRFERAGRVFCTAYDTEPFRNVFPTDPAHPDYDASAAEEGELVAVEENRKIVDFFRGAHVLIHDSQYTQKEYEKSKIGWGHSSFEWAINAASKARVSRLLLTHHDPNRGDDELDALVERYRSLIRGKTAMVIEGAREGAVIEV